MRYINAVHLPFTIPSFNYSSFIIELVYLQPGGLDGRGGGAWALRSECGVLSARHGVVQLVGMDQDQLSRLHTLEHHVGGACTEGPDEEKNTFEVIQMDSSL